MRNINSNRVSATITPAMVDDVKAAINGIAGMLPFLISLSEKERKALVKVGLVNKAYVGDALAVAARHPEAMPRFFSEEELRKDVEGFGLLEDVEKMIAELAAKIRDTRAMMGAEAYVAALAVYQALDSAERLGATGAGHARKELSGRFKKAAKGNANGNEA